MKPYQNLNGNSTVQAFQIYGDGIKIHFNDDSIYLYLYEKTGKDHVEQMKTLALEGKGLGSFVDKIGTGSAQKLQ